MALESCFSCGAVTLYSAQAAGYAEKLTDALQTPMLLLMGSLGGLWIVIEGIKLGLQKTDVGSVAQAIVTFMFASAFLALGGPMIQGIYTGSLDVMGNIASVAFRVGGGALESTGQTGVVALVANAELAVKAVLEAAQRISWKGTLTNPLPWLYGLLIALPYIVLAVLYMAQITIGIFRVMMVATFSPLLILCTGFKVSMPIAISGLRTLMASMFVVFGCTIAVSMIIYGVTSLDIATGVNANEQYDDSLLANGKILMAIALGWLGSALMFEATGIANSMAQVALGNSGAATMAGGLLGSGAAALRAANPATMGRRFLGASEALGSEMSGWGAMGGAAGSVAKNAAEMIDKFKNINKPPPPPPPAGKGYAF